MSDERYGERYEKENQYGFYEQEGSDLYPETEQKAPEASEKTVKKKKKKKRKKKNYLLRFFVFLVLCTGLWFFLNLSFFDVTGTEVSGNSYYTAEQISEKAGVQTGKNIFFECRTQKIKQRLLKDTYIRNAKISRKLPSTIRIEVEERKEAAAVQYGDTYIIVDSSGLVLRQTDTEPKLTLLVGLTLQSIEEGKALAVEENYVLSDTLKILEGMEENDLYFKKIDLSGVMIKAYIYDNLICSGTPEAVSENLENGGLQKVLYELYSQGIERGTITVNSDGSCAFHAAIE